MTSDRLHRQIGFLLEIDKLKGVLRRSYVLDGERVENTAEHSWHLVLLAMVLVEYADEPVELVAVLEMLAVHDLVEIDAGDTYVYDTSGTADTKAEREQAAADRIFALLPDDQATALRARWDEFEAGVTPEARFAKAVDRLMPLLHNHHTRGRSWQEHGVHPDQVRALMASIAPGSPRLHAYALSLVDDAVARGFFPRNSERELPIR